MKTVTTDQKRRIVVPNAEPGEIYQVREIEPGHLELTKMIPAPRQGIDPGELKERLAQQGLTPAMSWESLKQKTREW
jgi:hypothetical protein